MTGQTISHYRILEKLGEGGMGVVWKAEDTKLKRTVALKFVPPDAAGDAELRTRFLQEAQAAATLSHPNVCTVFEIDEECGFLAMEFVEGETAQARARQRPLPLPKALDIAMQAAQGLQAAHDCADWERPAAGDAPGVRDVGDHAGELHVALRQVEVHEEVGRLFRRRVHKVNVQLGVEGAGVYVGRAGQ